MNAAESSTSAAMAADGLSQVAHKAEGEAANVALEEKIEPSCQMEGQHIKQKRKLIELGEHVLLKDMQGNQKIVKVTRNSNTFFGGRKPFALKQLYNAPYGVAFRFERNEWRKYDEAIINPSNLDTDEELVHHSADALYDHNSAQNLTADEIVDLRKDLSGEQLVEKLVENSTSFTKKSTLAQRKYVFKKQKKHLQQFTVAKPTLQDICETYYKTSPTKIGGLRFDYLSLALTYGDIRPSSRVLVLDQSLGLLTAAVAMKLNGSGVLYRVQLGDTSYRIIKDIGLSPSLKSVFREIPSSVLADPEETQNGSIAKEDGSGVGEASAGSTNDVVEIQPNNKDDSGLQDAVTTHVRDRNLKELQRDGVHAFIAAISTHRVTEGSPALQKIALNYLAACDRYIVPDGRLVLYCGNMVPLLQCQAHLLRSSCYINVRLEEVFLREHQIINKASHPKIEGSVRLVEGFLLSAIKIEK